jgi:hypothetical protein
MYLKSKMCWRNSIKRGFRGLGEGIVRGRIDDFYMVGLFIGVF